MTLYFVLIFLGPGGKFNRKWTNQAIVQYCWWARALVLKVFLSKVPFNPFPESSTCLQSETPWNHRISGWKGPQQSPGQPSLAKAWSWLDDPVRQICVQRWRIQHFPRIFQGLVVLTVKSALYRAAPIAVVDFCTSEVLFLTEPGCFLLLSPACSSALCISAQLQLQTWRAGWGKKGRQIHSSTFLSS